jgi:hypothetical protein
VNGDIEPIERSAPDPGDVPGITRPSEDVRAELAAFIEGDQSRLGQVFRGLQSGQDAYAIARELDVTSTSFVWNYDRLVRAVLDADLPTAPTVALAAARKFRSILRSPHLSPAARSYLESNLPELERRAENDAARLAEDQAAKEQTEAAEARNDRGIYVYALPHYLRYPFEASTGRTLMKVGRSDSDVIQRFRNQTRITALPEEPILLRIYRTGDAPTTPVEADFHRLLEAAQHSRSVARTAGREWFLTTTRFLDEIARIMKLSAEVVNDGIDLAED